ncbi:MAG TPA: hypothetical protein VJT49_32465 [Amycolatopsis sp.]|uniref:hypothetical protein n=1 Tax=Amycolatopsis sp. TaxID=37632 RepID=UPI002B4914C6|nr:hypothetical protein [Amycolatopsis sp.]HKS49737.1 hypothetical protein [Amycolatopsis sp.]
MSVSSLDNLAWPSLTGPQPAFAEWCGRAVRYRADVSPFCALPQDPDERDRRDSRNSSARASWFTSFRRDVQPPAGWEVMNSPGWTEIIAVCIANTGTNDNAWWDSASGALLASDSGIVSALRTSSGFIAHDNGYAVTASDCNVDVTAQKMLTTQYDSLSAPGNAVQCGQIAVGADTVFTVVLGYGSTSTTALAAAGDSLSAGFGAVEASYRTNWNSYVDSLKAAPASVSGDTQRRRAYYVAIMALHSAEDKTYRGASVAGLLTPWGNFVSADAAGEGYHRVWGRDLYQQATGLLAAGDTAQARRMAQFMWNSQFIATASPGDGTTYQPGAFPRYSPVSGVAGATAKELGCCERTVDVGRGAVHPARPVHRCRPQSRHSVGRHSSLRHLT